MPGFSEQIRELVRSVSNHARRIRRLETLQTPITLSRPLGGHIIQDEGSNLPDQVYLNFEGASVVAEDDPGGGATKVTILGDDFCRVIPLPIGWEIKAGGTYRYLKHSSAFQLTDEGDDRGVDAIDLQMEQFNATYVAAADTSAILTNEQNKIEADCTYSVIIGQWNEILDNSGNNYIIGFSNEILNNSGAVCILGHAMDVDEGSYGTLLGYNHEIDDALGFTIWGEQNEQLENVNDYPTYCTQGGILNIAIGNVFGCYQFGEDNKMFSLGSVGAEIVWTSGQFGFRHYAQNVSTNWQFGQSTKSYIPDADASLDMYDGRIVHSGDYSNDHPSDGTGEVGGFNQDSWFSQNDIINTWNVAWTTMRFQFPIIQDSIWTFLIYVSATEKGCVNSHSFKIEGCIENDGGVTTMLASTVTNIYRDVVTKECQAIADNANDRLAIQFRDTGGPDATWTNIQISMFTVEVGAEV